MRVLGKIVGGVLGYVLAGKAGPLGALFGAALGHQLFDRPPRQFMGIPMSEKEIRNSVFFAATFSMLGKLAQADGRVSDSEVETIKSIINDKFQLSRRSAAFAFQTFEAALQSEDSFETHARAFKSQFEDSPEALASMLEIMLILAHADMEYDAEEETLIRQAAEIFGIENEYDSILAIYLGDSSNLEHCYQLLGLTDADANDIVEARYHHLLKEHDPKLLLEEGVPKELLAVAEEKHEQIKLAYQQIMSSRDQHGESTS